VPYRRYNESAETVMSTIEAMRSRISLGLDRLGLQTAMSPGAARNALDCALWDLEAKRSGKPACALAGLFAPKPMLTAHTITLGSPEEMAAAAHKMAACRLLKVKLGGQGDRARLEAVRRAAPSAQLIVDVNEGWTTANLTANLQDCKRYGVTMVEQPLPAIDDQALADIPHILPICADESVHDCASMPALAGKYDMINIKLDKCGGLTEALKLAELAASKGFSLMVGCMVATSLALAPAMLVAQHAQIVDLDGAFLLAKDRPDGLRYEGDNVYPPVTALWG
jgi:L-alanine-DL-glutamate epimerase-like enolase superfamily enzyme